jgi:hypothetical protein
MMNLLRLISGRTASAPVAREQKTTSQIQDMFLSKHNML